MTKDWIIAPRGRNSKGAGSSAIVRVVVLWVGFGLMGEGRFDGRERWMDLGKKLIIEQGMEIVRRKIEAEDGTE
jgi:hypothetical protein